MALIRNHTRKVMFGRLLAAGVTEMYAAFISLACYPDPDEPLDWKPVMPSKEAERFVVTLLSHYGGRHPLPMTDVVLDDILRRVFGAEARAEMGAVIEPDRFGSTTPAAPTVPEESPVRPASRPPAFVPTVVELRDDWEWDDPSSFVFEEADVPRTEMLIAGTWMAIPATDYEKLKATRAAYGAGVLNTCEALDKIKSIISLYGVVDPHLDPACGDLLLDWPE